MADQIISDPVLELVSETIVMGKYPFYDGEYTVNPTVSGVVIPTKDTILRENIVINPMPFEEEDNDSGGKTVSIGVQNGQ